MPRADYSARRVLLGEAETHMKLSELIQGVGHLGIPVCHIGEAALWYEQKLGFEKMQEASVFYPERLDMLFLRQKNLVIELFQPAPHLLKGIAERGTGVIDHFALDAPDFQPCAESVYKKGANLHVSTPKGCVFYEHLGKKGVRGINFEGPNGEVVELCHDYNREYDSGLTGLQGWSHLAVKISSLKRSLPFYEKLGFQKVMEGYLDTEEGRFQIVFVENHGFVLELIQVTGAALAELKQRGEGRLDHIALDVKDARQAFYLCRAEGLQAADTTVKELPVFSHGVRYFTIVGPDGEKIELNEQKTW